MNNTKAVDEMRSRGRPTGPEAGDIRGSILDTSETLFARQGYAATSLRQIADEVDVNPAMINYYFGGKRRLLQAVLERVLEPLAAAIATMRQAGQAPAAEIVQLLLQTFGRHPNLPYLVVREIMLPGGEMQAHFLEYLAPRLGGAIPGMLQREQAAGRMREDLDPAICTVILMSLCAFPFIARQLAQPALNVTLDEPGRALLEQHIQQLLEGGFSP